MAKILEKLVGHIESSVSALKSKQSLFINQMPVDVELGALLKVGPSGFQIDGETGVRKGKLQVVVRGKNSVECEGIAQEISDALTMNEVNFDDELMVRSIRPLHEPVGYMISAGNNYEYSVNLFVIYVMLP